MHSHRRTLTPATPATPLHPPGYNIINFDLPYIFERARTLKVDMETHQWGRIRHRCGRGAA